MLPLSEVSKIQLGEKTDGLIFTPAWPGVGSNEAGHAGPLEKITWASSLKWKPPEFNTIDFLVINKLDKNGKPEVHHIFQEGKNMQGIQDVIQYKTIELHCGFDIRNKQHAFVNPFQDVVDDKMVKQHNKLRLNYDAMSKMIAYHSDYHLKPVWDGEDQEALAEIMGCIKVLDIPQDKVWFMPAGDSREALFKSYPKMFDWVRDNGYRLTWRPHIIAFEDKREV